MIPAQGTTGNPVVRLVVGVPAGTVLGAEHLETVPVPDDLHPDQAISDVDQAIGNTLAIGQPAGAILTSSVFVGSGLANHDAGEVLVPFRVGDAGIVDLLRVGDELTIVAATAEGDVITLATDVRVAVLPTKSDGGVLSSAGSASGALIVGATTPAKAQTLALGSDFGVGIIIE
jgi:hypothetical protein